MTLFRPALTECTYTINESDDVSAGLIRIGTHLPTATERSSLTKRLGPVIYYTRALDDLAQHDATMTTPSCEEIVLNILFSKIFRMLVRLPKQRGTSHCIDLTHSSGPENTYLQVSPSCEDNTQNILLPKYFWCSRVLSQRRKPAIQTAPIQSKEVHATVRHSALQKYSALLRKRSLKYTFANALKMLTHPPKQRDASL